MPVQDLDFAHRSLIVRSGKGGIGGKDRLVMLPQGLTLQLQTQLAYARLVWAADVAAGQAGVEMPHALERKSPRAGQSWAWFWVFPPDHRSTDPRTGVIRRHHLNAPTFQRAFKRARQAAGVAKPATPNPTLNRGRASRLSTPRAR